MKKLLFIILAIFCSSFTVTAQLGDLLKRKAGEGARQGAQNGVETAIDKGVGKIFKKKNKNIVNDTSLTGQPGKNIDNASLKTYSKYDFVPGEKVLGFDDFSQGNIGDFPGNWTTNATGEIVTVDKYPGEWLDISKQGLYIPSFIKNLPGNFTLEYDLLFIPSINPGGPNTATLGLQMVHTTGGALFDLNLSRSYFEIDPYLGNINIAGYLDNGQKILTNEFQVNGIQRQHPFNFHVAVWRQKNRLRVYLNETKVVDAPSLLSSSVAYNAFRYTTSLNNDGSKWLISNLKFAAGLPDTRNKILNEGKFSTTGIVFDINSATIKPISYGTLKDVANVLSENPNLSVKIVGYTDSDGDTNTNLSLSLKRAEAVKDILAKEFSVNPSRLETEGKGESEPAAPNNTAEGKAQNRRVEFISLSNTSK